MRPWLMLCLVVVAVFAAVERNQLFVRDPLGSVTREGVTEPGAQVYVNFQNDVLLENDRAPVYLNLLVAGQPVRVPLTLRCIHYLVCFLDGNSASQTTVVTGATMESMSAKEVRFRDAVGRAVQVSLR